tara:strand:- start:612 stop:1028 length:417 start_codon:yes stop_codon:yes gene_type:complete
MNDFHIDITCPDCNKKILVEGDLNFRLMPSTTQTPIIDPPLKPKKQKKKITKKKKSSPKSKVPKKGKYDKDLEKLFKLKAGGPIEDIKLLPSEAGNSGEAIKRMEEAAKKMRKDSKNNPSMEKQIQDWLSGGENPFSP